MTSAMIQWMARAMRLGLLRLCVILALAWTLPAHAHKPSDAYLTLQTNGANVTGQWDIALRDLDFALGLDVDGDGALNWGEVRRRHNEIAAYALSRLHLSDTAPCRLSPGELLIDQHTDGAYAVLRFAADCPATIRTLTVDYRLFADLDAQHKGLLRLVPDAAAGTNDATQETQTAILGVDRPRQTLVLAAPDRLRQFADYVSEGIWHIGIGIDHILFLVALLLPAVLVREAGRWIPTQDFRAAFWDVVRVVTAFTVAHSITLTLATLGLVDLPSRLVESVIAASVVLAALNNVVPRVARGRWLVAFGFGLIHGFGFATVLADLGLPTGTLAVALLGFNVGVEFGQLAIVAAFLPVAFVLRSTPFYRRIVMIGGSLTIALIASAWFVERSLDIRLMSLLAF